MITNNKSNLNAMDKPNGSNNHIMSKEALAEWNAMGKKNSSNKNILSNEAQAEWNAMGENISPNKSSKLSELDTAAWESVSRQKPSQGHSNFGTQEEFNDTDDLVGLKEELNDIGSKPTSNKPINNANNRKQTKKGCFGAICNIGRRFFTRNAKKSAKVAPFVTNNRRNGTNKAGRVNKNSKLANILEDILKQIPKISENLLSVSNQISVFKSEQKNALDEMENNRIKIRSLMASNPAEPSLTQPFKIKIRDLKRSYKIREYFINDLLKSEKKLMLSIKKLEMMRNSINNNKRTPKTQR
jgi:hypothetical protein